MQRTAILALLDSTETQVTMLTTQLRHIRGLLFADGSSGDSLDPVKKAAAEDPFYLSEQEEDKFEKLLEEERLRGLQEADALRAKWAEINTDELERAGL